MADLESASAQRLLKAFMQFRKTSWHNKKIAGFNPSEFKVLNIIEREANQKQTEMKVSDISRILQVTPPTVTQIVNVLEKEGLVERKIDPGNRRAVQIKLTAEGAMTVEQARKALTDSFSGLIDYLGVEESEHLAELLNKVHQYYDGLSRQ